MRLPKASSASVPTIACSGTPACRVRVPISPTSLPWSVCSSSLPSPVMTARLARMRESKSSASSTHGAPGSSVAWWTAHRPPERPPAQPVIGTPRGSRGQRPASSARRSSSRFTMSGSAPFCGPNTFGACSNGVRTSHSTTRRAPPRPPASSIASSAPAPPSVVAEPPTATTITCAPAAAAAAISSPVP